MERRTGTRHKSKIFTFYGLCNNIFQDALKNYFHQSFCKFSIIWYKIFILIINQLERSIPHFIIPFVIFLNCSFRTILPQMKKKKKKEQ